MSTLIMVRMVCCESYKECGSLCSICPNRPENMDAVRDCQAACERMSFGRRVDEVSRRAATPPFQNVAVESAHG